MTQDNGISIEKDKLTNEILSIITKYDKRKKVDPKTRQWMAFCLAHFVHNSVQKFVDGQQQHGGNFRKDCAHVHEAIQEVIDLFWYLSGTRFKKL